MAWYAWSEIKYGNEKDGLKVVKPGDSVTASKLGIDEDEWDGLVEARAVRETKYPDIPRSFTGSPRDYILEQRKKELADIDDLGDALAAAQLEAENEANGVVDSEPEPDNDDN